MSRLIELLNSADLPGQAMTERDVVIQSGLPAPDLTKSLGAAFCRIGRNQLTALPDYRKGKDGVLFLPERYVFTPSNRFSMFSDQEKEKTRIGLALITAGVTLPLMEKIPQDNWSTEALIFGINYQTQQTQFPSDLSVDTFYRPHGDLSPVSRMTSDPVLTDIGLQMLGYPPDILNAIGDRQFMRFPAIRTLVNQYLIQCNIELGPDLAHAGQVFADTVLSLRKLQLSGESSAA